VAKPKAYEIRHGYIGPVGVAREITILIRT
jgi:hypothetical protein